VVRDWLSVAVYPLHWAVDAPFSAWQAASGVARTHSSLQADNGRLAGENRDLRLRLMRFEALEEENRRLREARVSSARVAERSLVAGILRVDLDPFRQRVLIDKGSRDGVFAGQAALDAHGVFGQVTRVGPVSAQIIMISDPEHAIPVHINRTGMRTIAVGVGNAGMLMLPYLPRNADIVEGDLVVSSGLGGVYPPGYPVARINEVVRDPAEALMRVGATPLAHLDRDPEVLLVWFDNRVVEPTGDTTPTAAGVATPGLDVAPTPAATEPGQPAASVPAPAGQPPAPDTAAAPAAGEGTAPPAEDARPAPGPTLPAAESASEPATGD
jgi:rod shape-determining protein MreC